MFFWQSSHTFIVIPAAQRIVRSHESSTFDQPFTKPQSHYLMPVLHESHSKCEKSPDYHSGREEDARRDFLKDDVIWDLADGVTYIED